MNQLSVKGEHFDNIEPLRYEVFVYIQEWNIYAGNPTNEVKVKSVNL